MKHIGDMQLQKGDLDGIPLIMWDALPECEENCSIYESCPYDKGRLKCEMRRRYLDLVVSSLDKSMEKKDQASVLRMGLFVVPLFGHLISMKILENSLGGNIMQNTKVHSVYKEMRGTIKMLNEMLKEIGIDAANADTSLLNGNSEYYDRMIKKGQTPG